jgi:hypothetical protein
MGAAGRASHREVEATGQRQHGGWWCRVGGGVEGVGVE